MIQCNHSFICEVRVNCNAAPTSCAIRIRVYKTMQEACNTPIVLAWKNISGVRGHIGVENRATSLWEIKEAEHEQLTTSVPALPIMDI